MTPGPRRRVAFRARRSAAPAARVARASPGRASSSAEVLSSAQVPPAASQPPAPASTRSAHEASGAEASAQALPTALLEKCDMGVSAMAAHGAKGSACVAASKTKIGPSEAQSRSEAPPPTAPGKKYEGEKPKQRLAFAGCEAISKLGHAVGSRREAGAREKTKASSAARYATVRLPSAPKVAVSASPRAEKAVALSRSPGEEAKALAPKEKVKEAASAPPPPGASS